ncbi:deaminase domain-containing protein [Listeria booriae]|uniref:deaminase domain-containing protein n=1 Tax=Listeria booriae TaxID=1552123 RepID=UPI001C898FB9|nr:deaminase domain-containing protein [Listeria booriae]
MLLSRRGLPPVLEPYVGGECGLVSGLVAGGGAWVVRGVNSVLYIPTTGVFKPRVARNVGNDLKNKSESLRKNLKDFVTNYKNSDEYLSLSNSQKKRVDRKLDRLGGENVATAEVNIPGLKKDFKAHSQIHSTDSLGYMDDFSVAPAEKDRILKNYIEDDYPRYNDTEAKILEDIASKIKDPNVKGEINLFSELDCCQSCTNLILEFRQKYPNIKVNIITNNTLK